MVKVVTFRDPKIRHAQRWYYQMGKRVWFHEVFSFLFRDKRVLNGPTVSAFWGETLEHEACALDAVAGRKTKRAG